MGLAPYAMIEESEGTSVIISQSQAQQFDLKGDFLCRRITLNIHSALDAVGFIAHISAQLANAGIPTNPVAGFYHDHLFVPVERANDAMAILDKISQNPNP